MKKNIQEMKAKHVLLKEYNYKMAPIDKGYNNRTLYINISDNTIKEKPVTEQMKEKFIGGKGFGLRLLWDGTKPNTKWNDPENEIIILPDLLPVLPNIQVPENQSSLLYLRKPIS